MTVDSVRRGYTGYQRQVEAEVGREIVRHLVDLALEQLPPACFADSSNGRALAVHLVGKRSWSWADFE